MKRKFSDNVVQQIVKEYKKCHSPKRICSKYGMSKSCLYNWVKECTKVQRRIGYCYTPTQIYAMERKLAVLQEENQIFRESGCSIKSSIDEKMAAIERLKERYTIHALCRTLNLSKGTYYNRTLRNCPKTMLEQVDDELRPLIKSIFEESKGRFGAEKVRIKLLERGRRVSRKHISRLMKEMSLVCKQSQLKYFNTTNRKYVFRKNLVLQKFEADLPNTLWVSDITYIRVESVFHALCVIIDIFSRKVVAYEISPSNDTALVVATFKKAFQFRGQPSGLTFHSDQGAQYASYIFRSYLRELGVVQSFSNPETPHDNAVAEAFFSVMKREEVFHNYYHTPDELDNTVSDFIQFYNELRPHRKLKNLSPEQYEKSFFSIGQRHSTCKKGTDKIV